MATVDFLSYGFSGTAGPGLRPKATGRLLVRRIGGRRTIGHVATLRQAGFEVGPACLQGAEPGFWLDDPRSASGVCSHVAASHGTPAGVMNRIPAGPSAAVVIAHTPPERLGNVQGLPISRPVSGVTPGTITLDIADYVLCEAETVLGGAAWRHDLPRKQVR